MVLPNPRSSYKAQLLDYDALLAASEDSCSYCLTEREVQMLLAFVDYIAWKTRYINTVTPIDTDLIRTWSNNLARKLMDGCCGNNDLHRYSPAGVYQSSSDGGITWTDDPENDPRNTYVGLPPLPGSPGSEKKCAAADNVRDLFTQYRDNLIEIVGATPTIIAIVAGILAFIGVLAGVSGVGVGISVLFLSMAAEIVSIGGVGISGAITFTALQDFRCLVYCRMDENGELTYAAWQQLLVDIADHYSGFAETFFYQTVNGMGYIGINNAGTIGAATATDCDCDCGAWCYTFDFTLSDGGWSPRTDGFTSPAAAYSPGVGWISTNTVGSVFGNGFSLCSIYKDIGSTANITGLNAQAVVTPGTGYGVDSPGQFIMNATAYGSYDPMTNAISWTGSVDTAQVLIDSNAGFTADGSAPGGSVVITRMTLVGTGINPFGLDNCP